MINTERLVQEFCELVSIDSTSFHERQMTDVLKKKMEELHMTVFEDQANHFYQSEAGNLYGFLKGNIPGKPLLFSSHMDTVEPGIGKKALIHEDGTIVSKGETVLGADDVAGIVAILESIRVLEENQIPHRDIEVLFPIAEEVYIQGSRVFDFEKIQSQEAYVLDISGPIGTASLQEPTLISFQIEVIGKSSHAGFAPEEGIHSIYIASQAIGQIKQGKVDEETTINIGKIQGGVATNIVPDRTIIEGEIRSYTHEKALSTLQNIIDIFETTTKLYQATYKETHIVHLHAYKVLENEKVVQRFLNVCQALDIPARLTKTFGGSDNNSFMSHGIKGIVLACGMNNVHTTKEYTTIHDLEKSTQIIFHLMKSEE